MTELKIPEDLRPNLIVKMPRSFGEYYLLQYIFKFENNYGASVVKGFGTYGGEDDKWELATVKFVNDIHHLIYDNPVCDDDVVGWLSDEDVVDYLYMIKDFTEESLADYVAYRDMEE